MRSDGPVTRLFVLAAIATLMAAAAVAETWQPPEPEPNQMDWIRMNSGEWLAGELNGLRDLDLEFDSDELGLLQLDFSDVAEYRSPRFLTYVFDDIGHFTGPATIKDGKVQIRTFSGVVEQRRADLLLIIESADKEIDFWSARLSLGFVARTGNTDQSDVTVTTRVRRQSPGSRITLDYAANYSEVDDAKTTDNQNATATYDVLVSAGFFVTPLEVNLFRDDFQNVDLKTTVSAGVGYDVCRGGDFEWTVGLGIGYQQTNYTSVQEGADENEDSASLIPSTEIEWDITGNLELYTSYNAETSLSDVKNTFHHAWVTLSVDLIGDIIDLDLGLNWDRVENPQPDADGNVPERDDLRTTVGIAVDW